MGRCPADLVLKNVKLFNVFTGNFTVGDVAVFDGRIAGIGSYSGDEEIDLSGKFMTPGFIDGHVHIESSMVSPSQFASAVVPCGTTTVIADPHEIANVAGVEGIRYMLRATEQLPLNVYFMLPSCVPATDLENSGAKLTAQDLLEFINHPRVLGLGEMMNYPGVLHNQPEVMEKIALFAGRPIDGHAPGLSGKELTAYIASGIRSDHECTTVAEAQERLAQGVWLMLREGSAAKNLENLLPVVNGHTVRRCMFATDDRHPHDLIEQGHINHLVRLAVAAGTDIAWVLQMATINAAQYLGIQGLGAIAPGYRADLLVFDNLENWKPAMVFKDGELVAQDGQPLFANFPVDDKVVRDSLRLGSLDKEKLRIKAASPIARVIGLVPQELVTQSLELPVPVLDGEYIASAADDILKLAVIERHHGSGNVGVGLVKGLGLSSGAIASTVAHDSHNIVVVGANDDDMLLAVKEIQTMQGGIIIVNKGKVLGSLPLPIAGLMADQDIVWVQETLAKLHRIARDLGVKKEHDPFMTLSFLSLPVIPSLKLTDRGLVDVDSFRFVSVSVQK